jgi:hypothetical protein
VGSQVFAHLFDDGRGVGMAGDLVQASDLGGAAGVVGTAHGFIVTDGAIFCPTTMTMRLLDARRCTRAGGGLGWWPGG